MSSSLSSPVLPISTALPSNQSQPIQPKKDPALPHTTATPKSKWSWPLSFHQREASKWNMQKMTTDRTRARYGVWVFQKGKCHVWLTRSWQLHIHLEDNSWRLPSRSRNPGGNTHINWFFHETLQAKHTLQGINISHLGKRKIIFKMPFLGDMLVSWRVVTKCHYVSCILEQNHEIYGRRVSTVTCNTRIFNTFQLPSVQRLVDFQKGCSSQQDDLQQRSHDQISIVSLMAERLGKMLYFIFFIIFL